MCPTRERRCAVLGRERLAVKRRARAPERIRTEKGAAGFYCSTLFTIFGALEAFCLNLGSVFKPDKIAIGKTNGLICGE